MKRKILNILVALVMVLGLSLIPAITMGVAEDDDSYVGYSLYADGTSTAKWDTANVSGSKYSVELNYVDEHVWVEFIPAPGTTMSDLADHHKAWSFKYNMVNDVHSGGPNLELRFTSPTFDADTGAEGNAFWGHVDLNTQVPGGDIEHGVWTTEDAYTNPQVQTYFNDPVDGTPGAFDSSPFYSVNETLAAINAASLMTAHESSADDWELTRVRVELAGPRVCYIDDVTIFGVTYDLEPIVMDAAYYNTGGTVTVTVYNGYATGVIAGYAYSTTTGIDYPITYQLTDEESTGVFTGSFDLGSDGLLVNEGDTIYLKCTANWGDGAQTIGWGPTAIIDDTAPEITIVSPEDEEITDDATPVIEATLADADSGIDEDTIDITVDDDAVDVADYDYDSDTGALTYTPSDNLTDGDHTVTVDVSDIAGNAAEQASWTFTVDTVAPVITDPAAEPPVMLPDEETEIVFTATVTDATSGVATVTIDLTDVGGDDEIPMLDDGDGDDVEEDDGIYTATADITETHEDEYELTITATDEAGNEATEDITLVVSEDIEPPVITIPEITYPAGYSSARVGDDVTISATVIDDVGMGTVTADSEAFAAPVTMTADDDIYTGTVEVVADTEAGDYIITITATDAKGNEATDESLTLIVSSVLTSYDIDLIEGWNLISTPLIPDDSDIDVILADITDNVSVVWAYVYDEDGVAGWKVWGSGDSDLDEIVDGQGYWIEMTADNTLTISGVELPAPPNAPPAYSVYEGWNLIGFKSVDAMDADDYLAGDAFAAFVRMYGYDTEDAVYTTVLAATHLLPGQGYWLAVSDDGTIYP